MATLTVFIDLPLFEARRTKKELRALSNSAVQVLQCATSFFGKTRTINNTAAESSQPLQAHLRLALGLVAFLKTLLLHPTRPALASRRFGARALFAN
ncbi:hypothetical protein AB4Z51_43405 [Bradyrhizobium sp. 2TAF36]|uniref:hypothetical protein n=1 Tax=Bradyrhizobium sp. 2TAF36 TaxID=3233016 RepID=UPI003F9233BA